MAVNTLEVNEIVCVESIAGGMTLVHFRGGRYIETTLEDAIRLQKLLSDRLLKIMAVYGDPPEQPVTIH